MLYSRKGRALHCSFFPPANVHVVKRWEESGGWWPKPIMCGSPEVGENDLCV